MRIKASQLLEEGLLIMLALVMIALVFGVANSIVGGITDVFSQVWSSITDLGSELFGWLIPG
ncbi:hypothetical protein DRN93_00415 [archaeon]|nr:MAG: hypothetical protein DRN93_00415 [archaeon]